MDSDPSSPQTPFYLSTHSPSLPSQNSGAQHNNVMANNTTPLVSGGDDGSENDGFLSGEEEFETAPDRPAQPYPDGKSTEGDVGDAPFVNSAEFFTPMAKAASVDAGDEPVGGVSDGDVFGAAELELGGDGGSVLPGEGSNENLGSGEVVKESGFGDGHEEFVEASAGGGDEKGSESGKFDGFAAEENGVQVHDLKDEEVSYDGQHQHAIPNEGDGGGEVDTKGVGDSLDDTVQVVKEEENNDGQRALLKEGDGSGEVDTKGAGDSLVDTILVVKEDNSGLSHDGQHAVLNEGDDGGEVDTEGVGDSVIDTLQVDLLASGVAVVGDKEEVEDSEIKALEGPARGVSLDNEFDPIEQDAEEAFDKLANVYTDANDNDAGLAQRGQESDIASTGKDEIVEPASDTLKVVQHDKSIEVHADEGEPGGHVEASGDSLTSEYVNPNSSLRLATMPDEDDEEEQHPHDGVIDGSVSDDEGEEMIFGSSEAAKRFMEELEQQSGIGSQSGPDSSRDLSQRIDGQIVTDSDEEVSIDGEGNGKQLFDSATLAAVLKAATGAGQDGGSVTITSQDGSRLFSVERPAGLGPFRSGKPATGLNRGNLFTSSTSRAGNNSDINLSEEEKNKLEKLQQIRIKFLRLVQRLGFTPEESIAAQVLYRLTLVAGRQHGQIFSLDAAKESARQLEAEGRDDLNCSLNILVIGKTGVGKSATINSIFDEMKTNIGAYGPATTAVTEIVGMVDGVKIRIFDTPGLKSSAMEQSFNRKVLSMVKKLTKKSPPDIVLYVDRLDTQTRDLNDLPLLRSISDALGPSIWRNAVVTLTHAASAPPDGPAGSPLSYDAFVAQRSHIVQQSIGQAVGDLRLMNPSLMNPVSLVENHPSCRKNRDGQKVLPNGQSWRPLLLLLCYSMKILSEAGNLSKTQESFDHRRLFGFRVRSPPLPYLLSWLLQSRTHPKLPADQGSVDNGDSDIELADLSDSDLDEDEDEYDQLLPFKPLKKSQVAKLSREQRKAYFEEYDYRVKLLQKKQWKEELKRMREMKRKGKTEVNDYGFMEEDDQENGSPATVPVPLPDMALPSSFDSDNPAYRYRFLEPTSQLLTRPVLDTHGWDHDCGYDGVNLEHSLAIVNQYPAAVAVQITKDKKDFSIHLDSSIAAKHGDNGSSMAGFDIQNIGKQLAYILRGETKFKNFKRNKTVAGVSVTFLGENVSTGLKVEDQIALGKRLVLVGSAGIVRSQGDSAYGSNLEVRLREADFPIGQDQSSLGLSLVKWRGDLALGANLQSQFSIGRSYKMAVRAGLNNKHSGQITVRTSSSDQLQIALLAILPVAQAIYKNFWPQASENYSIY